MLTITLQGSSPELLQYKNFIRYTYLKTIRASCDYFKAIPADVFNSVTIEHIENILNRSFVTIIVPIKSPEVIIGYSVHLGKTLNIVFVKKVFRGNKLSRKLIPSGITKYTTFVNKNHRFLLDKYPNMTFNPYNT